MHIKIAIILLILTASIAHPDEAKKAYVKIEMGGSVALKFPHDNYANKKPNKSFVLGAGMGHKINQHFSAEMNFYNFPSFDFNKNVEGNFVKQEIKSNAFMVSGNLNLPLSYESVKPFITAGVGYANNDSGDYTDSSGYKVLARSTGNVAWNVGTGVKWAITEEVELSLTYRYFDLGKVTTSSMGFLDENTSGFVNPISLKLKAHTGTLGIQYNF